MSANPPEPEHPAVPTPRPTGPLGPHQTAPSAPATIWQEEAEEIRLLREIRDLLRALVGDFTPPQAVTAITEFTPGGATMGTATTTFVDVDGVPTTPPKGDGSGLVVTLTSSDTTVATVGATTIQGNTYVTDVTRVTEAAFILSTVVANTSNQPLLDDDGVTAFVQPAETQVPAAAPGQAVTAVTTFTE